MSTVINNAIKKVGSLKGLLKFFQKATSKKYKTQVLLSIEEHQEWKEEEHEKMELVERKRKEKDKEVSCKQAVKVSQTKEGDWNQRRSS